MGLSKLKDKLGLRRLHPGRPGSAGKGSSAAGRSAAAAASDEEAQKTIQPEPSRVEPEVPPDGEVPPDKVPPAPSNDVPIRKLWDTAFEKLRVDEEALVHDYEARLTGLMPGNVGATSGSRRDQMEAILQRKMEEVNRETWRLRFGTNEVLVKDLAQPALGAISRVNEYISGALASNPYASIAWTGVSLLLPLLLNPSKQAASLAKGLDHISSLVAQSRMWEELYVRRYEGTSEAGTRDASSAALSHAAYKNTLESLYKEILKFQVSSYRYYANSGALRVGRDIVKWDDWDTLLDDVRERERVFREVSDIWRDMKYDEECAAADQRHRDSMLRWDAIGDDVAGLRKAVDDAQRDHKRAALLDWLCDVDPSEMYNAARDRHEEGTGDWLVWDCEEFRQWEELPGSFLWLHGKAGCGKSILTSTVIKHLRDEHSSDPRTALAYFYFSFSDSKRQNVAGMLASLVKQLCARRPVLPQVMEGLYGFKDRGERPDAKTLEEALTAAMGGFSAVHIVIDALDECPLVKGERRRLLDTVRRVARAAPATLHLFCTSRKEADIDALLRPLLSPPVQDEIDLTAAKARLDHDIGLYIDSVLDSLDFDSWPDDIKEEAREVLIERADGMFQYVAQQFDALRNLSSVALIRKALSGLPVGLDATYDRLLQGIDPKFDYQVASTLKWLSISSKDFEMEELSEIFILRPDRAPVLDPSERLFKPHDVLKYLSGLVLVYDAEQHLFWLGDPQFRVRLAHFSIREYLVSDRIARGPAARFAFDETEAHLHVARSCLAYHLQFSEAGPGSEADQWRGPLCGFAASAWPLHLEKVPRDLWPPEVANDAARALAVRSESLARTIEGVAKELQLYVPRGNRGGPTWEEWEGLMRRLPQRFTAFLGLAQLTDLLISPREYPTKEDLDQTLLAAAHGGSTSVVDLLLDKSADIDAIGNGSQGSALWAAVMAGHEAIAERLLEQGANINSQFEDRLGRPASALVAACDQGRTGLVRLLVRRGADVNFPGVLTAAVTASYDHADEARATLQLLCDTGADVNMGAGRDSSDSGVSTPLHAAAVCGNGDALAFLLQRGADPNAYGGEYGYPLQALCSHWRRWDRSDDDVTGPALVNLLLAHGVDINARGGRYGTALHGACHHHYRGAPLVKFLLDRGADPHARGGRFETALQAACTAEGAQEIVRLLLGRDVDVHAQGGYYGNALQAACHQANLEVVKLLLDLGVDVNAPGGVYGTALQAAAAYDINGSGRGHGEDIVRLLLERGADVNQVGGAYGTALQAAAFEGRTEIIRLLLRHGADVNMQGGTFGTALQAASLRDDLDVVRLLLENGADVNARAEGSEYHTAFQAACHNSSGRAGAKISLLLLEHGADVRVQGGRFGSAFHAAATQAGPEWETVLQLLLDRGVDINDTRGGPEGNQVTALQAVLEMPRRPYLFDEDKPARVRFLLDRGADVNIQAGKYGFPLQSACCCVRGPNPGADSSETLPFVEILLEYCPDLDINAQGGLFESALQAAAFHGQTRLVEVLLRHGAHANPPRGGKYGSPLNAAVVQGYWDIVKVLLAAGATPDCQQLTEPDEEWLERVREEHGRGAVERYRVFWEKHKSK